MPVNVKGLILLADQVLRYTISSSSKTVKSIFVKSQKQWFADVLQIGAL